MPSNSACGRQMCRFQMFALACPGFPVESKGIYIAIPKSRYSGVGDDDDDDDDGDDNGDDDDGDDDNEGPFPKC